MEESVAVTLYDWSYPSQMIRARVLVQYCTCETRPRYTENCMDEAVFSENVVQAFPGGCKMLAIHLEWLYTTLVITKPQVFIIISNIISEKNTNKQLLGIKPRTAYYGH